MKKITTIRKGLGLLLIFAYTYLFYLDFFASKDFKDVYHSSLIIFIMMNLTALINYNTN